MAGSTAIVESAADPRQPREIRRLPPTVVNKIAAGEVIERPASVVKELVENALDAGAGRICVEIELSGSERIAVVDDGCGLTPEQLPLAVASHATSKLRTADDLFCVRTLGFRGEALASIAEISRLRLRSRTHDALAGAELLVRGGQADEVAPCAAPPGTLVEVRDLFFNTPVRRKFLRALATEMGHISEAFIRLALAHPSVHFRLEHNGKATWDLPAATDERARIGAFFGQDLAAALLLVESRQGDVQLRGWVAPPAFSRANQRMQYLFLNGRYIRDRALQHALSEAYRGLLTVGRHPVSFLSLSMPPELVDVNVHPTKLEVRFLESGALYSQLLGALRLKFLTTDLSHSLQAAGGPTAGESGATSLTSATEAAARQRVLDWANELAQRSAGSPAGTAGGSDGDALRLHARPADWQWPQPATGRTTAPAAGATADSPAGGAPVEPAPPPGGRGSVPAMQVHNKYLIVESPEGVVVIDQHALHERVLYEQLKERTLGGALQSQRLLVPEPVELQAAEAAAVLEHAAELARLGIEVEGFGGATVLVTTQPAVLRRFRPAEMLRSLAESLLEGGRLESRDVVDKLLHMMACKAAVKAGDPLHPDEIAALIELRHLAQDSHHCPHGRPTALVFTREELDRQFKRT